MGWEEFVQSAMTGQLGVAGQQRLATACLMRQQLVDATKRRQDLPVGRPSAVLATSAAARLSERAPTVEGRVIGRVIDGWGEPSDVPDAGDRFDRWLSGLAETISLARTTGDPCLLAWTQASASSRLRVAHRPLEAEVWADRAKETLSSITSSERFWGPFKVVCAELVTPGEREYAHFVTTAWCWKILADTYRRVGDLENWDAALDAMASASREVVAQRPSLLALALNKRAIRDRVLGRPVDMRELEELAEHSVSGQTTLLVVKASNASHIGAYRAAIALHKERVSNLLKKRQFTNHDDPDLEKARAFFAPLPENERRTHNSIANGAYEIARALVVSGEASVDTMAYQAAHQWLGIAEAIWNGWATNGLHAVRFLNCRITLLDDNADIEEVVNELLDISLRAPRPGLTVNAVAEAATLRFLPDEYTAKVTHRVEEMLATARWDPQQRGRLLAALAWLRRRSLAAPVDDIRLAAEEALTQLRGSVSSYEPASIRAHWVLAEISTGPSRIEHYRKGLQGVCRLLLRATTPEICLTYARTWSPLIRASLDAGVAENEHELFDMAAEVVRRDGLSVQLADAYLDKRTSAEITDVIQQSLTAANAESTDVDEPETVSEQPEERDGFRSMRAQAEEVIAAVQIEAGTKAREVLGSLGAALDPDTLIGSTARKVLEARGQALQSPYVLQYLPARSALISPGITSEVYRRLTWRDERGAILEYSDLISVPARVLEEPPLGSNNFWIDGKAILPPALISALEQATVEHPLRLIILPTGLFHLLWDALEVSDDGTRLFEKATVTVHTSLVSATMPPAPEGTPRAGSTAVFDKKLEHTSIERAALTSTFPELQALEDLGALRVLQGADRQPSVFAMGVHGNDDQDGWGQYKVLPNGELFTAAEALNLRYPELCVLASCHSQIRLMGGLDLAGFPSAMFARGARTVIGSVGAIPDRETAEILTIFYTLFAEGLPIPHAIRQAKLRWLAASPESWRTPGAWAKIVTYGSAHS